MEFRIKTLKIPTLVPINIFRSSPTKCIIPLPYASIAKAARYCDAHFTAILYGEMSSLEPKTTSTTNTLTVNLRDIMKDAYTSIGEMDAVPAFLDPVRSRLQYLQLNQSWNQIYLEHDVIAFRQPGNVERYTDYLAQSGLYCLANSLPQTSASVKYDCAWRLGDWSLVDTVEPTKTTLGLEFDKHHYFALKCFNDKDEMGTKSFIRNARDALIKVFKQSSFECTKNVYKNLGALHLLQQIEEFCDVRAHNAHIY